jgi:hypothetical protein
MATKKKVITAQKKPVKPVIMLEGTENWLHSLRARCSQICPECTKRCLGSAGHDKFVEHQCKEHFWICAKLEPEIFRSMFRTLLRTITGVDKKKKRNGCPNCGSPDPEVSRTGCKHVFHK